MSDTEHTLSFAVAGERFPDAFGRLIDQALPFLVDEPVAGAFLFDWVELVTFEGQACLRALMHDGRGLVSLHEPLTDLLRVTVLTMEAGTPSTEIWLALYGAVMGLMNLCFYLSLQTIPPETQQVNVTHCFLL